MIPSIGGAALKKRAIFAEQLSDPESKRTMLRIASDYERLAEHAEFRARKSATTFTRWKRPWTDPALRELVALAGEVPRTALPVKMPCAVAYALAG